MRRFLFRNWKVHIQFRPGSQKREVPKQGTSLFVCPLFSGGGFLALKNSPSLMQIRPFRLHSAGIRGILIPWTTVFRIYTDITSCSAV